MFYANNPRKQINFIHPSTSHKTQPLKHPKAFKTNVKPGETPLKTHTVNKARVVPEHSEAFG